MKAQRWLWSSVVSVGMVGVLAAQTAKPTFEVASVKVSPPPETTPIVSARPQPGGRWIATNADLLTLIRGSYVEFAMPGQIVGEPTWIRTRFDVNAKAEGNASFDELRAMAQQMLHDRFALRFHIEQRPVEVYALVMARSDGKPRRGLTTPAVDCAAWSAARAARQPDPPLPKLPGRPACGFQANLRDDLVMQLRGGGMTMADLANFLPGFLSPRLGGVDRTGLRGRFDSTLDFAMEVQPPGIDAQAVEPGPAPPLLEAVEDQLGLKMEKRREPVDVMVIDSVQPPTEN